MTPWEALVGAREASFADVLRELRPLFPPSLLDGEGWTRLLERVAELPAAAAQLFGFEFRLGDVNPSADVCVPVSSDIADRFLREARGGRSLPPSQAALAHCVSDFGRADSALARWAASALLEYDIAALSSGSRYTPGIYFILRNEPGSPGHDVQDCAHRDIAPALANACGWTPDLAEERELERVINALPRGARVGQAGAMPERARRAIRVVVWDVDAQATPAFLERLRWPGRIGFASGILTDLLAVGGPRFGLSIDVTAQGVGHRLGLELLAGDGRGWRTTTRSDWQPCVERLVERGWCTVAKAEGLLEWPGYQKCYAANAIFLAHQGINHSKITIVGDVVKAKGYVGMSFVPLQTST